MPVTIDRLTPARPTEDIHSADSIEIGLLNNMPDSALEATERQFTALIEQAAESLRVRLRLFAMPQIRRADRAAERIKALYAPVDTIWHSHLDAFIVTGAEPVAPDLREEPYWNALTRVIDWANENTVSTIFSCLAAHAAVLHIDGIARRPLSKKRFGIYPECVVADHVLTRGMGALPTPHSRWNELREKDLAGAGYDVLTRSEEAGVGLFTKQRDALFLFFQGHPEYEAESLLREYRRDIGRYLRGERPTYPGRPLHYFDHRARDKVALFKKRAVGRREKDMLNEFPIFELRRTVKDSWRPGAVAIYRNWLRFIGSGKPERLAARPTERKRAANL
jgi:homoserine O-succinyltransferase